MNTYLVTRRHGFGTPADIEAAAARSAAAGDAPGSGVSWIRTYVVAEERGGCGTVCVFQADDAGAIRAHAASADLPVDEILVVADTVVVRPDPG